MLVSTQKSNIECCAYSTFRKIVVCYGANESECESTKWNEMLKSHDEKRTQTMIKIVC